MVSKNDFQNFESGQSIIREGEQANYVYLIQKGKAKVIKNNGAGRDESEIAVLGPGEIFGEIGLLGKGAHTATVKAVNDITVIPVSREQISMKLENSDPLVRRMLEMLVDRINKANERIISKSE